MTRNKAQLDLFAPVLARPKLCDPDPRIVELATSLPKHVRLGSSSWNFRGWTGLVYRAAYPNDKTFMRDSLYEYSRWPLWGTVGIDRSFYSPIGAEELAQYAAMLPPQFRCVEKVWQELSTFMFPRHPRYGERAGQLNPYFLDPGLFAREVLEPHDRSFSSHVAAFVLEISPLPRAPDVGLFLTKLEAFLANAPPRYHIAVELRDERLMTERYFAILRAHSASHCFNQWSHMPPIREQLRAHGSRFAHPAFARLLLPHGASYDELVNAYAPFDRMQAPSEPMREDVLSLIDIAGASNVEAYIIINNKAEGSSPLTAIALAELMKRDRLP